MSLGLVLLTVAVVVMVGLAVMQILMQRAAERRVGHPAPALAELPAQGTALVWFHSPSCGPCRAMEPGVQAVAAAGHTVIQIDVTQRRADVVAWSVTATPTSVFVRDGVVTASRVGALSEGAMALLLAPSP